MQHVFSLFSSPLDIQSSQLYLALGVSDTDSIIAQLPVGNVAEAKTFLQDKAQIEISSNYRAFKFETLFDIQQFRSLGPKNYSLKLVDPAAPDHVMHEVKVRGFSLRGKQPASALQAGDIDHFVTALLQDKQVHKPVHQFRLCIDKKTRQIYSNVNVKQYSNANAMKKRVVLKGHSPPVYLTLPYGSTTRMHNKAINDARRSSCL